jgi:hypothetical protein
MQEGGKEVEVCIKFVKRYSVDTHKFCASEEFAPHIIGWVVGGYWNRNQVPRPLVRVEEILYNYNTG